MPKKTIKLMLPDEAVISRIYLIRGEKVMLDSELSKLYGVTTGNLNKAVKRNIGRFPKDFMFQLSKKEYESLRFQIGILKRGQHAKYFPYVFTEQGVAMLSSVLNSETAIKVNIQIIRVFTKMRKMLLTNKDLLLKIEQLEKKYGDHDQQIIDLFEYLKKLVVQKNEPRKPLGFKISMK